MIFNSSVKGVYKNKTPLTEELKIISHTVMGAMKNVVDKTVEIANSIKPNGELRIENGECRVENGELRVYG